MAETRIQSRIGAHSDGENAVTGSHDERAGLSTYRYSAFGLLIESDVPLRELSQTDAVGTPDIKIVRCPIGHALPEPGSSPSFDYDDLAAPVMIWPGVAAFRLVGAKRIEIEPYPDVPESYLAFPILGPIMGWMIDRMGKFVMHASAVAFEGRGVAFLGDKMAGKSTTAAAFLRDGAELMTDDLLVLDIAEDRDPMVMPAFAQLKLSDESAAAVHVPGSEALPLVYDGFAKRQHRLAGMHEDRVAADLLLVLKRCSGDPAIRVLDEAAGFVAATRFSYHVRFGAAPYDADTRARHFRQGIALARKATIAELAVPDDMQRLPEVVETVRRFLKEGATT